MFKNMKLSAKLIGSFVIVAVITLAVGFVGWRGINGLSHDIVEIGGVRLPGVHSLMVIEKEGEAVRVAQRTLLNPNLSREDRLRQLENVQAARSRYEAAWKVYESLPKTPEEAQLWNKFVPAWEAWRQENSTFFKLIQELDKLDLGNPDALNATIEMIRGDHYKLMAATAELIDIGTAIQGGEDASACRYGRWAATFKTQNPSLNSAIAQNSDPHRRFHQAVADIKAAVDKSNMEDARDIVRNAFLPAMQVITIGLQAMDTQVENAVTLFDEASHHAMVTAREKQLAALDLLEQIVKINEDAAHVSSEEATIASGRSKTMAIIGMVAGFLAALAFGIFLSISITRALTRIIEGLSEGAEQVASASGQVSAASQSLAEGSSEQAASIEETSSSLEEMSSMTRQNADNANQADTLMKEANLVVTAANQSMGELTCSMVEISKASEETSKIIKTIDEIAFQTNLLALNAAVEAARAGEAGAGFAVVANEVRNLAMRAAEAAKNTANLIEGTVKQVKAGGELVGRTNENFSEVAKSSAKVAGLVAEIAAASSEQAQGISQVNTAVNEVDKVTQQNAANAEESASASEEMNAQAEQMKVFVAELVAMVGASKNGGTNMGRGSAGPKKNKPVIHHQPMIHRTPKTNGSGSRRKTMPAAAMQEVSPEEMIPMDKDFAEF